MTQPGAGAASRRLDRQGLVAWARERFDPGLTADDIASTDLDELMTALVAASARRQARGDDSRDEMRRMERSVLLQILDNASGPPKSNFIPCSLPRLPVRAFP